MANYFTLTLDTTGPANPQIKIENGALYTTNQLVLCSISTSDSVTTGYQMKVWGNVDKTHDTDVQDTEVASTWITYGTSKQVKLSTTDGNKTVYLKIRDDVHNPSAQASANIILDTDAPAVTISGPDVSKISKQTGKDEASFSFQVNEVFDEYKVKVVASSAATHDAGTVIPTTAGSTNMSGTVGSYPADTAINCKIKGADLETASTGDGAKTIKVFAKDKSGQWSA